MGQTFGQLTDPGSALVDSDGNAAMIGAPSQIRDALIRASANFKPFAQGGTTPAQNPMHDLGIGTPSFQEAATAGATPGGGNALSPGLSKAGKLATLLTAGLQGALAGRAKSEETVAATGGRRSGGAGMGFEAGFTLPWQRAAQQNQLAQQQAQTGVLQSEAQTMNIPGLGPVPGWLAKSLGPAYLRGQAELGAAGTRAGAQVQSAQLGKEGRVQAAEIGKRFIPVPNVGLYDTQQRSLVPGTAQGIMVTPEIAQDYQLPQDFIGKPMTLQNLAAVQRSSVFENVPQMTAEGPIIVNRRNAQATPVTGPGGQKFAPPALASPIPVAPDPNNPGNVVYMPRGSVSGMAAPQGAATQAATTAARSEVPTQVGNQRVAFNTAMQHADLLQGALQYLNDPQNPSNIRTWNSIKNRFKTEFGSSDVTNFNVIANAYTREVTKMLSAGHLTDAEISQQGATIPANASPQQILGALRQYRALAQSKLNMLNQQVNSAKTGGNNRQVIRYDAQGNRVQ